MTTGSLLTPKFMRMWRNLLEDDTDVTHPRQWVGFYKDGEEDPEFITHEPTLPYLASHG